MTKTRYSVQFIDPARRDFLNLDKGCRIKVAKLLKQLETNPFKGERLGNKAGIDLTGYYKLYADRKRIRIVYTVLEHEIIVKVIAIGPRKDMLVYVEALRRTRN